MIRFIKLTVQLLNPLIRFFESFHSRKLIYLALSCQLIKANIITTQENHGFTSQYCFVTNPSFPSQ